MLNINSKHLLKKFKLLNTNSENFPKQAKPEMIKNKESGLWPTNLHNFHVHCAVFPWICLSVWEDMLFVAFLVFCHHTYWFRSMLSNFLWSQRSLAMKWKVLGWFDFHYFRLIITRDRSWLSVEPPCGCDNIFLQQRFINYVFCNLGVCKSWVATQIWVMRPSTLVHEIIEIYISNLLFSLKRKNAIIYDFMH